MGKVRDILRTKGHAIFSVEPSITVYQAVEQMCERNIGGLLIVEEHRLVGIFTERDYARKLILKGKSSKDTPISELMTKNPFTVTADNSIEDCMDIMTKKHIRHLPVVDGERITGVISIGDVVKQIMDEQRSIIEHLENYITS
jgi:CBS domain-containing protein